MTTRRGLSLLEVLLALSIFGTALALLGELIRIGARSAAEARDMTTAQLYCESIVAEIASGIKSADPVSEQAVEQDANWLYTVNVEAASQSGLVAVTVKVERNLPAGGRRTSFTLSRWIVDPGIEFASPEDESSSSSSSGPTSTPSPSSSGSGAASPAGGASG